jgi:Raf kinase inhibitor-like YbhB/YbcL family protein
MAFTLTSPAFDDGDDIPARFTCDGENRSPELRWTEPPTDAKAFALIVEDPDAPSGLYTHWILTDVPGTTSTLAEGIVPGQIGVDGINSFGKPGYGGPCPPPGHGVHRYYFRLHALKDFMRSSETLTRDLLDRRLADLSLGQAVLIGRYARQATRLRR